MRSPLPLLLAVALASRALEIPWQQAGASFGRSPGLAGMIGQGYATDASPAGSPGVAGGFLAHPYLLNTAPFLSAALEDAARPSAFPAEVVLLPKFFADLDGDALSFSVTALGTGLDLVVAGDTLRLAGQTGYAGSTSVVVKATDPAGSVSDTFVVRQTPPTSIHSREVPRDARRATGKDIVPRRVVGQPGSGTGTGAIVLRDSPGDLQVDLLLDGPSRLSVAIFDLLGVPLLSMETTLSTTDLSRIPTESDGRRRVPVSWNKRTSAGDPVPTGIYVWRIELVGADGTRTESVLRLGVAPPR